MKTILGALNGELLLTIAHSAAPFCSRVDAAVAYAEGPSHPLIGSCKEKNLPLTFYGLLDEGGAVAASLLKELLAWGPSRAEPRLVKGNFHAKVIWWRGYGAYVGSANLTHKAWFNNIEAGVWFDESDLSGTPTGNDLERLFEHLSNCSVAVTQEMVEKLEILERDQRRLLFEPQGKLTAKFDQLFANVPENRGLTVKPAKGHRENTRLKRFAAEWTSTLEKMRGLAREFAALSLRPKWVDRDADPAVHFDQFLHAYYYDFVRGRLGTTEEDDVRSGLEKVEASFSKNARDPSAALKEGARWWAALTKDCYGEEQFIRETAPQMRMRLSKASIATMDLDEFREAVRNVNAFRMHARQVRNVDMGLPLDHHESLDDRVNRLCNWLWDQRTASGKSVREVLEFVVWGTKPADMEERLWLGVWGDDYRLPHFGQSTLGEAVGWARPDRYPPRNNRTNKALRALGHDVKLFSNL